MFNQKLFEEICDFYGAEKLEGVNCSYLEKENGDLVAITSDVIDEIFAYAFGGIESGWIEVDKAKSTAEFSVNGSLEFAA